MTSNTPPQKPEWFALIEKDAPSAQVRKIDKKLPAITGFLAITIVALGTFFTNGSLSIDSSAASNSASNSTVTSISAGTSVNTVTSTQVAGKLKTVKVVEPQSINKIMDPALNGGGSDEDDEDEDYEDEDEDEDEEDRD